MKRKQLEKRLRKLGAEFVRHGGSHDHWRLANGSLEPVPRHADVVEPLAKAILRRAEQASEEDNK